jgi:hypothetical protein
VPVDVSNLQQMYDKLSGSELLEKNFGNNADGALFYMQKQGVVYLQRYLPVSEDKWAIQAPSMMPDLRKGAIEHLLVGSENPFWSNGQLALGWHFLIRPGASSSVGTSPAADPIVGAQKKPDNTMDDLGVTIQGALKEIGGWLKVGFEFCLVAIVWLCGIFVILCIVLPIAFAIRRWFQ